MINFSQACCIVLGLEPTEANRKAAVETFERVGMVPVQLWGTSFHQPVAVGVNVQKRNPFYYVDSYEHDDYPPAHGLLVLPDFKQGTVDQGIRYIEQPENEQSTLFASAGSSQLPSSDDNQQHDDIDIGNDDEAPQSDPVPRIPSIAAFNNSVKESLQRKKDRVSEEECLELLQMMYYVQRPANVRVTQRPRFFTNQDIAKTVMRYYNKFISVYLVTKWMAESGQWGDTFHMKTRTGTRSGRWLFVRLPAKQYAQ